MNFLENETKMLRLQLRLAQLEKVEDCQNSFLDFVHAMWPEFIMGTHHEIISEKFEQIAKGEINRLIINMPPRHTKSEFASFLFPAWMIGRNPPRSLRSTLVVRQRTFLRRMVIRIFFLTRNYP